MLSSWFSVAAHSCWSHNGRNHLAALAVNLLCGGGSDMIGISWTYFLSMFVARLIYFFTFTARASSWAIVSTTIIIGGAWSWLVGLIEVWVRVRWTFVLCVVVVGGTTAPIVTLIYFTTFTASLCTIISGRTRSWILLFEGRLSITRNSVCNVFIWQGSLAMVSYLRGMLLLSCLNEAIIGSNIGCMGNYKEQLIKARACISSLDYFTIWYFLE